jgi:hypothetical protein
MNIIDEDKRCSHFLHITFCADSRLAHRFLFY